MNIDECNASFSQQECWINAEQLVHKSHIMDEPPPDKSACQLTEGQIIRTLLYSFFASKMVMEFDAMIPEGNKGLDISLS
jgi:hypothetical protein